MITISVFLLILSIVFLVRVNLEEKRQSKYLAEYAKMLAKKSRKQKRF